jgi:hypothetical protein
MRAAADALTWKIASDRQSAARYAERGEHTIAAGYEARAAMLATGLEALQMALNGDLPGC